MISRGSLEEVAWSTRFLQGSAGKMVGFRDLKLSFEDFYASFPHTKTLQVSYRTTDQILILLFFSLLPSFQVAAGLLGSLGLDRGSLYLRKTHTPSVVSIHGQYYDRQWLGLTASFEYLLGQYTSKS